MAVNFSREDRWTLINLIEQYKDIVENKACDHVANSKKNETWEKIRQQFNSGSSTQRTRVQLQDLYKRIKIKARKDVSRCKKEQSQTGGGPPADEPDEMSLKIAEMLPKEFKELYNPFDDDSKPPASFLR